MRHPLALLVLLLCAFQFTHPGKGATTFYYRTTCTKGSFNSRTLGRVRHTFRGDKQAYNEFQFTHPGKGATSRGSRQRRRDRVSIHAPWEGCDQTNGAQSQSGACFNSRTLGRVRPPPTTLLSRGERFQFTHPGKGATGLRAWRAYPLGSFNSRTLGRVRPKRRVPIVGLWEFQFTHPGKGATETE